MRCCDEQLKLAEGGFVAGGGHSQILVQIKQHCPQLHFFIACVTVNGVNDSTFFARIDRIAGLAWGVHGSFRDYIQRLADGHVAVHDGAQMLESGETLFPLDAEAASPHELRFTGSLEFGGHHGMMAVTVRQPWLEHGADGWHLTIVDPFEPASRMALVAVKFDDRNTATTRLTEAGTDLFMGNYTEGTIFDPMRIVGAERDHNS